jgi:hypothetical protein
MRRRVALFSLLLLAAYLTFMVAQGDVKVPVTSGKASTSSGGGGSRSPDIENFIRQVESWKTNYKDRFEYLQKLLYKPAWTNTSYVPPDVWLYYPPSANKTINRTDEVKMEAIILNKNPIEIKRALYLTLEIMEPGETSFKPANTGVQIIQVNEYDEKEQTARRTFPELNSFGYLNKVGDVKLRVKWTDGEYKLYSSREKSFPDYGYYPELILNITNIPPRINNSTMKVEPLQAKWDDYIQYTGSFEEIGSANNSRTIVGQEEHPVQVTLHIYNNSQEVFNITKPFLPRGAISFSTKDASLFKESDAGKNFSYRYSSTDGIKGGPNTTWSALGDGPRIRPNPRIKVDNLKASSEDENYYWWQEYNFSLEAKSQSSAPVDLRVDLYTDTPEHPGKLAASQTVIVPVNESIPIVFSSIRPFDVADANQTFRYYFGYSAPDQYGKTRSDIIQGERAIGAKLINQDLAISTGIASVVAIFAVCLLIGAVIERRFYR